MGSRADYLIAKGLIVDGSGEKPFIGDIAVIDDRIVDVEPVLDIPAHRTIDASGLVVCPGFIDVHTHDDLYLFRDPAGGFKVRQGVTTVVTGNCGISVAPGSVDHRNELQGMLGLVGAARVPGAYIGAETFGEYLSRLEAIRPGINVACLVGHSAIRLAVMGSDNRQPSEKEMDRLCRLTDQAMTDGAFGISSGLTYPPGAYAATEELIEICSVVAARKGLYATHLRNESDLVIEAMNEALTIGSEAGLPVVLSHHKVGGTNNWGRSRETIKIIETARRQGQAVVADQYPYDAANTYLIAVLPPEFLEGGPREYCRKLKKPEFRSKVRRRIEEGSDRGWESLIQSVGFQRIIIASSLIHPEWMGHSVAEIALNNGKDPYDLIFDLVSADRAATSAIYRSMDAGDVERIMLESFVMIGSDGIPAFSPEERVHPRLCGTFPRILGHYVRELKLMSLEEAVRKMTGLPASVFGLTNKGLIGKSNDADLVVFDPEKISDCATFENPLAPPEGINFVFVGGKPAVEHGRITGNGHGRVLRHG